MPRLSIVVPFEQNSVRLESTLLSILENRPYDSELILVHRGNYEDPYHLANDEIILVEGESDDSIVELINEGFSAACAPIVEVLMPGTEVEPGWAEQALERFRDTDVAAVSVPIEIDDQGKCVFGIQGQWLPRRSYCFRKRMSQEVSPLLHGGFFRKRVILALNGFFDDGSIASAESEIGLAIRSLGMRCESDDSGARIEDHTFEKEAVPSYASGYGAGRIGQAYAAIEHSGVVIDSFVARIGHVASGLISPSTVAERLGWALGVRDHSLSNHCAARIERANQQLLAWRAATSNDRLRKVA